MIGDLSLAKGLGMPEGRSMPFGRREFSAQNRDAFRALCQRLQEGPLMFPASSTRAPPIEDPPNGSPVVVTHRPPITKRKASFQEFDVSPQNAPKSAKLPRLTPGPVGEEDEEEWGVLPPPPPKPMATPRKSTKGKEPLASSSSSSSYSTTSTLKAAAGTKEIAKNVRRVMKDKTIPESPESSDVSGGEVTLGPSVAFRDEDLASVCGAAKDKNAPLLQNMATSLILPKLLKATAKLSAHAQDRLGQFFKAAGGMVAADAVVLPLLQQTRASEAHLDVVSVFCASVDPPCTSHLLSGYSSKSSLEEMDVHILQLLCEKASSSDSMSHTSALSMLSKVNQAMSTSPVVGRCLLTATKVLGPQMEASSLQELRRVVSAHGSVLKGAVEAHLRKIAK